MKAVLTIAGSDSSGGAGIQADLKTFEAFGVFGTSAITVLTAQNTTGVDSIHPIDPGFIQAQIESVTRDFDIAAIKVGMLYSKPIIETVGQILKHTDVPVVLDPVFISKAGSKLLEAEAIEALKELMGYATVLTPNQFEAHELFGYEFGDSDSLAQVFDAPCKVLIKNHAVEMNGSMQSVDMLYSGREKATFVSDYVDSSSLHGTGCSYSSAIAANLALGKPLEEAIMRAKDFIYHAIANAPGLGGGKGPIHHKKGGELCQVQT
jgi:hydroxymethylpyrimidine/phosphomethylpyrimidine kinase